MILFNLFDLTTKKLKGMCDKIGCVDSTTLMINLLACYGDYIMIFDNKLINMCRILRSVPFYVVKGNCGHSLFDFNSTDNESRTKVKWLPTAQLRLKMVAFLVLWEVKNMLSALCVDPKNYKAYVVLSRVTMS